MSPLVALALALAPVQASPGSGDRAASVVLVNRTPVAQAGVVSFTMPFPRAAHRELAAVRVDDDVAPCTTLMRWPDGSVQLVRVDARIPIEAGATRVLPVEPCAAPDREPFTTPFDPESLPLEVEIEDPWGRVFAGRFALAAAPEHDLDSARVRVFRLACRPLHTTDAGERVGLLSVRGLLVAYSGERRAELTLALTNGFAGDPVIGPVRFRALRLVSRDDGLQFRPRFLAENLLPAPVRRAGGGFRQTLLAPSDRHYLGDRTAKVFRFDLFLDAPEVGAVEREAARWHALGRVVGLAELESVRATRAFGAHGGPAPLVAVARAKLAERELIVALRAAVGAFGPYGGFGDPIDPAAQGSPRNGPSALHNVVRWSSADLLDVAEGIVLQHGLRPTPGCSPRLPADTAAWRAGLPARAIEAPHGFRALDYEHFSVDLLFDHFWLTGDAWARDELARAGSGLRALLAGVPFRTARGEGWCLQAGVLIARATGDGALLADLLRHCRSNVIPALGEAPARPFALAQPPHPDALGGDEPFDAPWQMAALVHGLSALWRETGDDDVRVAIVQVARVMATSGWVDGVGPKYLLSATDSQRYQMPVGFSPREGTALFEIGAFVLAAEAARDTSDASLLTDRADSLAGDLGSVHASGVDANPWFQLCLDRRNR